ncbi:hypothetical protein [Winogradskyella algicola]|uniref:hypothetical protein n=1 Tax=Winogradskyella algicola TaxID=2575815 RepID=UPI001109E47B|nr:hypothetical protein [Winogradskyella algicola]
MRYEIPFDLELYYLQTKITFPYVFSDSYRKSKEALFWFIIFICLGIFIIIGKGNLGFLFLAFSLFSFYNFYTYNKKYHNLKNDYMSRIKALIDKENEIPKYGIFEFNKDCLVFTDDFSETKTEWNDFQEYKIVKSNLLLMRNKEQGDIVVIGKSEIGEIEFKNVISFVKEKIK